MSRLTDIQTSVEGGDKIDGGRVQESDVIRWFDFHAIENGQSDPFGTLVHRYARHASRFLSLRSREERKVLALSY